MFDFMYVCSLCFNPIIYSFRGKKFKEGLKRMSDFVQWIRDSRVKPPWDGNGGKL